MTKKIKRPPNLAASLVGRPKPAVVQRRKLSAKAEQSRVQSRRAVEQMMARKGIPDANLY